MDVMKSVSEKKWNILMNDGKLKERNGWKMKGK